MNHSRIFIKLLILISFVVWLPACDSDEGSISSSDAVWDQSNWDNKDWQ